MTARPTLCRKQGLVGRWNFALPALAALLICAASYGAPAAPPKPATAGDPVVALSLAPDGKHVLVVWGQRAELRKLNSLECLCFANTKGWEFRCGTFAPDSSQAVVGAEDGQVRFWSTRQGVAEATLTLPTGVTALRFTPDGKYVLAGCWDGLVRVLDAGSKTVLREIKTHRFGSVCLDFSADGEHVLLGAADQFSACHDWASGDVTRRLSAGLNGEKAHLGMVVDVAFLPNGKRALTAARPTGSVHLMRKHTVIHGDAAVRLWDLATGKPLRALDRRYGVSALAVHPAADRVYVIDAVGNQAWGKLGCLDLLTWTYRELFTDPISKDSWVSALALAPGGKWAVLGTSKGRMFVFDLQQEQWKVALSLNAETWTVEGPEHWDAAHETRPSGGTKARKRGLWTEIAAQLAADAAR